jgi:hypothetical protein
MYFRGYIGFPSFDSRPQDIKDVSLVVRHKSGDTSYIRKQFDIPEDAKCVLITFGGFNLQGTGNFIENYKKILSIGQKLGCHKIGTV